PIGVAHAKVSTDVAAEEGLTAPHPLHPVRASAGGQLVPVRARRHNESQTRGRPQRSSAMANEHVACGFPARRRPAKALRTHRIPLCFALWARFPQASKKPL